jgi:hypothetical protein
MRVKLGVTIKNGNNPERVEFDNANVLITSSSTPSKPFLLYPEFHSGLFKFNPFRVICPTLLT